jgi:hypothetical protein
MSAGGIRDAVRATTIRVASGERCVKQESVAE